MSIPSANDLELHQLILSSNDLALGKIYDAYGQIIADKLKALYNKTARTDHALIYEAVSEALWGYFRNPSTFDPHKKSLLGFLEIAAERDLLNILERQKKHLEFEIVPKNVELGEILRNSSMSDAHSADKELIMNESIHLVEKELAKYFPHPRDIVLARMVITGVRETEAFALELGIAGWDLVEQQAEVKRNKDRIKRVLERNSIIEKLKGLLQ
jgi:hypothetical protein